MHVVVVGCGRVGAGLATELDREGHSVAIIDKLQRAFRRLPPEWGGPEGGRLRLRQGAISTRPAPRSADALAAVTSGDNSNILTARIARETYEIANVVARIYDPRRAEIFQRLGIPTVPSVSWTIDQVFRRILPGQGSFEWTDGTGQLHLVERPLPAAWAGRRIASLLPAGVRLVSVVRATAPTLRGGRPRRPGRRRPLPRRHRSPLQPGCRSCSATTPAPAAPTGRALEAAGVKVAVAGAGKVGRFLAEDLAESGHEVLLLEKDADLAALVVAIPSRRGRPASPPTPARSPRSTRPASTQAEVVVAVTGDDEDNLVISLLSKQEFAVPRVIARVNHPRNHWLFNESWGVDVAVSTPQLLAGLVEEAVSVGVLVRLLQFEGGNTRLVEMTLAEGSAVRRLRGRPTRAAAGRCHRGPRAGRPRRRPALRHRPRRRRRGDAARERPDRGRRDPAAPRPEPVTGGRRRPAGEQDAARRPCRLAAVRQAAFFDLDKTVIARASMVAFGRPLYRGGLINRRTVLRALYGQLVYLHLGASEEKLDRIRESVLKLTRGWQQSRVAEIVAEALEQIVDPIIYAEAADLIDQHRAAGRYVVLISASPAEIVAPLGRYLGADATVGSRAQIDEEGRYTGAMEFYAYGQFKAEAMRELAERERIDLSRLVRLHRLLHRPPDARGRRPPRRRQPRPGAHQVRPRPRLRDHPLRAAGAAAGRVRDVRLRITAVPSRPAIAVSVGAAASETGAFALGWWCGARREMPAPR